MQRPAPPIYSVPLSKIEGVQVIISNQDDKVRLIVTPNQIMTTPSRVIPLGPGIRPQPGFQPQPGFPGQGGE
jgi:hypothetical protein